MFCTENILACKTCVAVNTRECFMATHNHSPNIPVHLSCLLFTDTYKLLTEFLVDVNSGIWKYQEVGKFWLKMLVPISSMKHDTKTVGSLKQAYF